ncbi:rubrerythrin family protein [archaeon]|nr:rubrerythrin family protein [archaeon]
MTETEENLGKAFAGESQANRKYLAFAAKAEQEGHLQIAKIFRAVADAETVHALNHFRVSGGIKSTEENLKEAIAGENYEYTKMYPGFIDQAKKEENASAVQVFSWANSVEKVHEHLYKHALENLEKGEELPEKTVFVCQVCGYTFEGDALEVCPVCSAPKEKFNEIQ